MPFDESLSGEVAAVVSALVGGAKYGIRVRAPHALVMTFLFSKEPLKQKILTVLNLTKTHAINLATFATIYKIVLALLKHLSKATKSIASSETKGFFQNLGKFIVQTIVDGQSPPGRRLVDRPPGFPQNRHHAFIAGAIGGCYVWGRYNSMTRQINYYLLGRVIVAFFDSRGCRLTEPTYPYFASLLWGLVMLLFEEAPASLQTSLKLSMDDIYRYQLSPTKDNSITLNS